MAPLARRLSRESRTPVFVTVLPTDLHLAALLDPAPHPNIHPIVVGNGLSRADCTWLKTRVPAIPIVRLRTSLRNTPGAFLPHSEVIDLAFYCSRQDFAIQDADCFAVDPKWWDSFVIPRDDVYAAGPFCKVMQHASAPLPDTYLTLLNRHSYAMRQAQGIEPHITEKARTIKPLLQKHQYPEGYFPEQGKRYFDTLQVHWVAATLSGDRFLQLPGENTAVFHIGGSTYLINTVSANPSHWDYWPINAPYFHLRLLEFPRFASLRSRFPFLLKEYQSAEALVARFPGFKQSARFAQSELLLTHFRTALT